MVDHLAIATARIYTIDHASHTLELQASAGAQLAVEPAIFAASVVSPGNGAFTSHPLVIDDRLLGMLALWSTAPLTAATLAIVQANATALALAIERTQRELEQQAELANLSEALRRNELVIGVLAHDLRNPLAAIVSATQLLRLGATDQDMLRPLERIASSASRIERMVGQLLDTARLRVDGGFGVAPVRVDLRDLTRRVVDELLVAHSGRRIEIEALGDTHGAWDRDRLEQALSNLVSNALVHGEQACSVRVRVDGSTRSFVTIEVTNRGSIPEHVRARVFDPFCGAELRAGRRSRGLGLGLFITRQIVAAHHGTIELRSAASDTTTFVIRLPREPISASTRDIECDAVEADNAGGSATGAG
jgi:signal transduction histidine kinase